MDLSVTLPENFVFCSAPDIFSLQLYKDQVCPITKTSVTYWMELGLFFFLFDETQQKIIWVITDLPQISNLQSLAYSRVSLLSLFYWYYFGFRSSTHPSKFPLSVTFSLPSCIKAAIHLRQVVVISSHNSVFQSFFFLHSHPLSLQKQDGSSFSSTVICFWRRS